MKEKQEALAQLSSKTRSSEIQIEHDENLRMHCIDVLNVKTAAATNTNRNGVPPSLGIPSIKPPSQRDEISKIGMNNFLSINTNFDDQRPSSATSRNVSFDGRSEHFEMTTPRIEVPTRDEEDERRLSNNPLPSPGAPPINPFPPQNTDLSVILPDFYYGIPTWVLQVNAFTYFFFFLSIHEQWSSDDPYGFFISVFRIHMRFSRSIFNQLDQCAKFGTFSFCKFLTHQLIVW